MTKATNIIPIRGLRGRGGKPTDDTIVESGTIGEKPALKWDVHKYGTIHIHDKGLTFKKDCDLFEEELDKVPVDLKPGDRHVIKASGDNDDLIIENVDGEYRLSLTKRGCAVVEKLRQLVNKAKSHKKK